jgi:microsomal dipeptidase-like Zn-dependent dipeptidase
MATRSDLPKQAEDLHRRALVIDGHSDILIPVTEGKMRLAERVEVPAPEHFIAPRGLERSPLVAFGLGLHAAWFGAMGQYDLPRWREGGVSAQVCAIYLSDDHLNDPLRRGLEMTWNLHHEVATTEGLVLATTAADIRRAKEHGDVAAVLSFEGCEALGGDLRFLDLYHRLGLRIASLTHTRRNAFADGCWAAEKQGGLTTLGRNLVERLEALRIVVDLVHIGEVGFWEILEQVSRPVVLSHTTPTMFPSSDPASRGPAIGRCSRPWRRTVASSG